MRHRISTGSMPYGGLTPSPPLDGAKFAFTSPSPVSFPTSRDAKTAAARAKVKSEKDAHKHVKATLSDGGTSYRKRFDSLL